MTTSKLIKLQDQLLTVKNKKEAKLIKKEIDSINTLILDKDREMQRAKDFNMSLKTYRELSEKAIKILESLSSGHSMGEHRRLYINNILFATNHNLKTYPKSFKYLPTYGNLSITITKKDLTNIQLIEGVWTIKGSDNTAKWLTTQGKKFYQIFWQEGFIIGTSHGASILECEELERAKRIRRKLTSKTFIGVQDIKTIGACDVGINNFCQRHNLNIEFGYTIQYLLDLKDKVGNHYFNRLIDNEI